eukprot:SAG22_NODE_2350_length_2678_cov_4.230322_2_plen_166_part_00
MFPLSFYLRQCLSLRSNWAQRQIYHENKAHSPYSRLQHRQISHTPEKILDAPDLLDDYYLNLLDWSSKDVLAVALGQTVYLWNAKTGQISQLMQTSGADDYVASLSFSADGNSIAVGTNSAQVRLFDGEPDRQADRPTDRRCCPQAIKSDAFCRARQSLSVRYGV